MFLSSVSYEESYYGLRDQIIQNDLILGSLVLSARFFFEYEHTTGMQRLTHIFFFWGGGMSQFNPPETDSKMNVTRSSP